MARTQRLSYFVKYELIRSFSPIYFTVIMGTGGISLLLDAFPYGQELPMKVFSLVLFFLNVLLFLVFSAWAITRYYLYPEDWIELMNHPTLSLFLGCFPMSFTTILNVAIDVIYGYFSFGGKGFLYSIWILWWINVAVSSAYGWGMLHHMITGQTHSLEQMSTIWLLPVVTLVVSSSTTGVLANALREYSIMHALITLTAGVFIVTVGFALSFIIFTIYFQRLFVHGLPEGAAALTAFLPLGPSGTAGFSIILIGQNFNKLFPLISSSSMFLGWPYAGQAVNVLCTCIAFLLWALASMFLFFGLLSVITMVRRTHIEFSPSFWGLIFPNSVYAILTITLGQSFNASLFRVYGAVYAVGTFILWTVIVFKSLIYIYDVVFRYPLPAIALSQTPTLEVTQVSKTCDSDDEKIIEEV